MKKLWQKDYSQNKMAEKYCFGDSAELDSFLVVPDVLGSIAHACMLQEIGILTSEEFRKLKNSLIEIAELAKKGNFKIELGDEDVHTKVENYLVSKLGDLGKKIHTGRSRNDQVLVDLKLFSKENLLEISFLCNKLIISFLDFAVKYEFVPMPGYTHMQKAMPSTVGMWSASFAESLLGDLEILRCAFDSNDQSPLGSAASYGVPLPLNRELTAKLLGFKKVQNNSLYAGSSRGKSHLIVVHALLQIMLTLSRFASDILLFTTGEFNFFSVDKTLSTGSSIMPQKKNLDVLECVRARTHVVISLEQSIGGIIAGLPSGYQGDFGETKYPFIKSIEIAKDTLNISILVINSVSPNIEILKKSFTSEIFAAHAAYQLVKKGIPFRNAYKKIGQSLERLPKPDPAEVIKMSGHLGGTGNLGLNKVRKKAEKSQVRWSNKQKYYLNILKKLGISYE